MRKVDVAAGEAGRNEERIPAGDPLYFEAVEFLHAEAELLDAGDFDQWLELLDDDLTYRMPVRVDRGDGTGYPQDPHPSTRVDTGYFDEDRPTMELRVRRLVNSRSAWAEQPRSRTKRLVTNIRVRRAESAELIVRSYLLLIRSQWHNQSPDILSATREDRLRRTEDGSLVLKKREIVLDQTNIAAVNIATLL
jgi:3-phenylpropionate/cinnamic acid dioxygenase small subunit